MRSWIFVIGAATMGVASVLGFYFAIARAQQRIELIAATTGRDSSEPLLDTRWLLRAKAQTVPPNFRCASCHATPPVTLFSRR